MVKVLLKRELFLEGVLYKVSSTGTEIPDKIGEKEVRLWTKEMKDPKVVEEIDSKKVIVLPEDAVEYKEGAGGAPPPSQELGPGNPKATSELPRSVDPAGGPVRDNRGPTAKPASRT